MRVIAALFLIGCGSTGSSSNPTKDAGVIAEHIQFSAVSGEEARRGYDAELRPTWERLHADAAKSTAAPFTEGHGSREKIGGKQFGEGGFGVRLLGAGDATSSPAISNPASALTAPTEPARDQTAWIVAYNDWVPVANASSLAQAELVETIKRLGYDPTRDEDVAGFVVGVERSIDMANQLLEITSSPDHPSRVESSLTSNTITPTLRTIVKDRVQLQARARGREQDFLEFGHNLDVYAVQHSAELRKRAASKLAPDAGHEIYVTVLVCIAKIERYRAIAQLSLQSFHYDEFVAFAQRRTISAAEQAAYSQISKTYQQRLRAFEPWSIRIEGIRERLNTLMQRASGHDPHPGNDQDWF